MKAGALAIVIVLAGCAAAGPRVEEAKRIVDRSEPLRCEVVDLEAKLKLARPGSEDAAGLAASLETARMRLKYHYLATMDEYIAVMKQLPFEERKAIYRYSDAAAERCSTR